MHARLLCALLLFTISAAADPGLFDTIHPKQTIVLVLPDGTCDAKVVENKVDHLTARLKNTTGPCGKRNTFVRVLRSDVHDVFDRQLTPHPDAPGAVRCALIGMTIAATTGGLYVGERFETQAGALAVMAAGGVAGALLCRIPHGPRYRVVADRIIPAQP